MATNRDTGDLQERDVTANADGAPAEGNANTALGSTRVQPDRGEGTVVEANQGMAGASGAAAENEAEIAVAVRSILQNLGEDPNREGLLKTPHRFARAMRFFTQGYRMNLEAETNGAIFTSPSDDLVLVKNITIFSLCEHHLLPFAGRVHIAYLPRGRVLGLSKLSRIADIYARRLQIQERLTRQIAEAVQQVLNPEGVAVTMECSHTCMSMRGVQKPGATTVTQCKTGVFKTDRRVNEDLRHLFQTRL